MTTANLNKYKRLKKYCYLKALDWAEEEAEATQTQPAMTRICVSGIHRSFYGQVYDTIKRAEPDYMPFRAHQNGDAVYFSVTFKLR